MSARVDYRKKRNDSGSERFRLNQISLPLNAADESAVVDGADAVENSR